jgi:2-polyprenyl-3-methyl-5-hydroxy-6-metoxy-1,4-benzoquinol methylase
MTEAKVEAQLNMDNLYHNRCPCCSGESFKECVKFDHRDIVECLSCHHQFAKTFSPKELTRLYQQDYYSSVDDPRILEWIKLNADVWDALIKNIPTTADLLDIGAGTGGFLLRCQKQLSEVTYYAVESSGAAREFIEQEVKGVEFLAENADDLSSIASSSVSCITLLQVLEHVTYPRVVLEEI